MWSLDFIQNKKEVCEIESKEDMRGRGRDHGESDRTTCGSERI